MPSCEFGSIKKIHARLISEGYAISEYALRAWVKEGRVPAVYSGKKAFIAYDRVLDMLKGDAQHSA